MIAELERLEPEQYKLIMQDQTRKGRRGGESKERKDAMPDTCWYLKRKKV